MRGPSHRILAALRLAAFFCASALLRLLRRRPGSGVLLVRLDGLGDLMLWLSSGAREVADYARSRGRCTALVNRDWAQLAAELDLFDELWPLDVKRFMRNPLYRIAMLLRLRRQGFAVSIQPRTSRFFLLEDLIVWTTQAGERIGNAGDVLNHASRLKRLSDRWYTRLIAVPAGGRERLRNLAFARGLTAREPSRMRLEFDPSVGARFGLPANYFVVAPGAGLEERRWPAARFGEIALRLHADRGWHCVVVGNAQEKALAEPLRRALGSRCHDLTGIVSLGELGAVLRCAKLVIANESGVAHFAAHVGTPAMVVLGGGHFGRFLPYEDHAPAAPFAVFKPMPCFGCNWQCRFKVPASAPKPCIEQIGVEELWHAIVAHA